MRIHEDNFAYEIEQVFDPATMVSMGWKYNVYRVRPLNQLLRSGNAESREAAEREGRKAMQRAIRLEEQKPAA